MPLQRLTPVSLWENVPDLSPADEQKAAEETMTLLAGVRDALASGSLEERRWDLSSFSEGTVEFLIATIGMGEVRLTAADGMLKSADTSIPGLWRVQDRRTNEDYLCTGRIPSVLLKIADEGLEGMPEYQHDPEGQPEFAAQAVLAQVEDALEKCDLNELPVDPPFAVEITRQPLAPGDRGALEATMGRGDLFIELLGFARSKIYQTKTRGVWYSRIISNAGIHLLDSYVVARLPAEVPAAPGDFPEGAKKAAELIEWLEGDLERGTIGAKRAEKGGQA